MDKHECWVCGRELGTRAGWVAHMRKHVREGKVRETLRVGFWQTLVDFVEVKHDERRVQEAGA